jgi:hypothetical protein
MKVLPPQICSSGPNGFHSTLYKEKIMTTNSVVAIYDTHEQAEHAIKEL